MGEGGGGDRLQQIEWQSQIYCGCRLLIDLACCCGTGDIKEPKDTFSKHYILEDCSIVALHLNRIYYRSQCCLRCLKDQKAECFMTCGCSKTAFGMQRWVLLEERKKAGCEDLREVRKGDSLLCMAMRYVAHLLTYKNEALAIEVWLRRSAIGFLG